MGLTIRPFHSAWYHPEPSFKHVIAIFSGNLICGSTSDDSPGIFHGSTNLCIIIELSLLQALRPFKLPLLRVMGDLNFAKSKYKLVSSESPRI